MHYRKYLKSNINYVVHKEQNKERRNSNKTMHELNIKYMNRAFKTLKDKYTNAVVETKERN